MKLPVQVTFRDLRHSDAIEGMVRDEAEQLDRYYNHIMGCRVMIEVPHRRRMDGDRFHVRIYLTIPGGEIVVNRAPSLHLSQQDAEEDEPSKEREIEGSHKHIQVAIREAFDTARRQLQEYARRQRLDVKSHEVQTASLVCRLFQEEGYGFIETPEGTEVYFHKNSVLNDKFKHLTVGTQVTFVEEAGDRGPQASSVKVVGGRHRHKVVGQAEV